MFPQKISQNIDILARIHGNVFPWQPTIMGNKASYYKSIFQISLPWLYLSFHNACPRHLKSRRDLLYMFVQHKNWLSSLNTTLCYARLITCQVGKTGTPMNLKKFSSPKILIQIGSYCLLKILGHPGTYPVRASAY